MVNGLLSGQMNLNDVRREARSSADQLRELKKELGPDADDSLDGYLRGVGSISQGNCRRTDDRHARAPAKSVCPLNLVQGKNAGRLA